MPLGKDHWMMEGSPSPISSGIDKGRKRPFQPQCGQHDEKHHPSPSSARTVRRFQQHIIPTTHLKEEFESPVLPFHSLNEYYTLGKNQEHWSCKSLVSQTSWNILDLISLSVPYTVANFVFKFKLKTKWLQGSSFLNNIFKTNMRNMLTLSKLA